MAIVTDVRDIRQAETINNKERILLVVIYLSNETTLNDKLKFLEVYLLPFSIKMKGLFLFTYEMKAVRFTNYSAR